MTRPAWDLPAARPLPSARRHRLRTRLALLYALLILASGAVLLVVTVGVWQHTTVVAGSTSRAVPVGGPPPPGVSGPGLNSASRQHSTDVHHLLVVAGAALIVLVVLAVVLGWLVAGRLLRPLRTITATARHISADNLHERLNLAGADDELTELGATLDDLFGRLETSFESQRPFVARASHELRTPLTVERTILQVALADPDATAADLRATCEKLLELGTQQERLIDGLLTLAGGETGIQRWEPFDLAEIAERAVVDRRGEAERLGVAVATSLAEAPTQGDAGLVESLIGNLVDNGLRHNMAGGRLEVATSSQSGRPTVSVRNTGPVIPPGEVGGLFRAFQRLGGSPSGPGEGHGLGLAIVLAIAGAHRATVTAWARSGGGLEVEVAFPQGG